MGKVNGCLKCIFIFFNVLFALLWVLLVVLVGKATFQGDQLSSVGVLKTAWTWVLPLAVLGLSCLGIFAGCSEKPLALKIFAGFMGVGMIVMLIFGITLAIGRNELIKELDPETAPDPEFRTSLDGLQKEASCCGLYDVSDWGEEIPDSCACLSTGPECQAKPAGSKGPDRVYVEPCIGIFMYVASLITVFIGLFFGLAVIALIGLLISLLMIHQIKRHDSTGIFTATSGY